MQYYVMLMWSAISQTQASHGERPGDEHVMMSDHGEALDRMLCFSLPALLSICFVLLLPVLLQLAPSLPRINMQYIH